MKKTTILRASTASLALSLSLAAAPGFAQVADGTLPPEDATASADGSEPTGGAIVVTGSRIARPNIEAPSPVTVVGAEQVQLTGTTTLETLLNELPQVIPGNTRVSNNAGGENFATLDLRGLGPGRTLILLNGERLPASTTTGVTDISQIPTALVQRVEVVTGGASAVYGSDAIAGVINFILRDDFEGVQLTGQTIVSETGAGFGYNISGIVGSNFADGRGNMTFYGSYTDRSAVSQGRFDYSRTSAALFYDPNVGAGVGGPVAVVDNPSEIPAGYVPLVGGGSATPPWGWAQASANGPAQFNGLAALLPGTFGAGAADTNCDGVTAAVNSPTQVSFNDAGALAPRNAAGRCNVPLRSIGSSRYNFAPDNYLITPQNRLTMTLSGSYEFSDQTRLRIYSSYTNVNQQVALAPTPATDILVPANSPLIPADFQAALATRTFSQRTPGSVAIGGQNFAFGGGRFQNTAACLDTDLNDDGIPDIPAGACATQSAAGEPFLLNRRFTETGPRIGDFTTDSKTIRAIVEHDISDNWSMNFVASYGRVDNKSINQGNIRRSAVNQGLRGCPVGSGPGCVPINIFGAGTLTPAMLSFVALKTTDTEVFTQLRVATNVNGSLMQLPGGPLGVAVGAEYRRDAGETQVDDAKRTGDIIGFNAQNDIRGRIAVKEVYGEVRAPIMDFITLGAGARYSDYSSVGGLFNWKAEAEINPTSWIKLRGTYNRAARAPNVFELFQNGNQGFPSYVDPCNATNTNRNAARCIAGGVPASVLPTFAQVNSQVQAFAFGNPNLSAEKAETWTAGVVLTPPDIMGVVMTLTADYYNIKLTNRVAGLGAGFFLSDCYSAGNAASCARIIRDPASGQISSINTTVGNSATPLTTAGIDVGLDARMSAFGGTLYLSDVLTYVDKYRIGDTEFVDTAFDGIGGVTPKWANTATFGWRDETITAQVRYVWKKGARQNFPGATFEGFFPNDARIPDLNLVNLSVRWQAAENFDLTLIANNILNRFPPQTATGNFEQANTNISFYDPFALGRNYAVQARVRF